MTPLFKQKGDPLERGNYRDIKLLSYCLKFLALVIAARLRMIVDIKLNQYGFKKIESITVGLHQGYVLSPLLFHQCYGHGY